MVSVFADHPTDETHVLYLNSYDYQMSWTKEIFRGLQDILGKMDHLKLYYESMDTKEFYSDEYYEVFKEYIETKYRDIPLSIIFCSDNNAFDFLRKYHKSLFPGVPVVFCGVNNYQSEWIRDHEEFAGIAEVPSIADTVELALELHPETEEIFVINDYLNTGRAWQEQIAEELKPLAGKIQLTYSENLSLHDLEEKVRSLNSKSLILLGVYYADRDHVTLTYEKMAEQIGSWSPVPVYTAVRFNLQEGVLGGKVISGYAQGEAIAEIGLRILYGELPSEIPIGRQEYNRYVFNYPELERFSIPLDDLPEGSTILNRSYSLYEEYTWEIWILVSILLILIGTTLLLMVSIIKKNQAQKTLRQFANATWEGIVIHREGRVLQINQMFSTIFGYRKEDFSGQDLIEKIFAPKDMEYVENKMLSMDENLYEAMGRHKEGWYIPVEVRVRHIEYKGSSARVAAIRDLTDKKKTEKEFNFLSSLWDNIFENSIEGIFIFDKNYNFVRINKRFTVVTGFSEAETLGNPLSTLRSENQDAVFTKRQISLLEERGEWSGELIMRRKSGEIIFLKLSISLLKSDAPQDRKYIGVFHDYSDQKQQEEELKWMARFDILTGFSNRNYFLEILNRELKGADRKNEIFAVLLLNIDGLKNINSNLGILVGDKLLKEFCKTLSEGLREEDIVSRFNGDEFAILAPHFMNKSQVNTFVKRIHKMIQRTVQIGEIYVDLSVSVGISLFPFDGMEEEELIAKSGIALKRTKKSKKGSYNFYNTELDKTDILNSELEMLLANSLRKDEMQVFFQPKVDSSGKDIKGYEALLRWNLRQEEWIPPCVFIPISEDTGFIMELGYFVINRACDFCLALEDKGYDDFHVGVNISARQFSYSGFIDSLIRIVSSKGVRPSRLDLEITESITTGHILNFTENLTRLSNYGFTISIDDFGTGYSSLQYLMTLPFDSLKIDKSFVDTIHSTNDNTMILDTMISLAHALKKKVVAEGVETLEQAEYLEGKECELIQGFYYFKPMPQDEILKLLEKEKSDS